MKFYIHAIINWVFLLKWPNYSEYSPKSACVFVSILPHEASSGTFWKRNEEENKYVRQYGLAYIWYTMAVRPVSVLSRQKGILKRRSRQWIWGSIFFLSVDAGSSNYLRYSRALGLPEKARTIVHIIWNWYLDKIQMTACLVALFESIDFEFYRLDHFLLASKCSYSPYIPSKKIRIKWIGF